MTSPRSRRVVTAFAVLGSLAVIGLVGAPAGAAKTRGCKPPASPAGLKGGYFTELRATNVSCKRARRLVRSYYKCRMRKGIRASCSGRTINGLKCRESRPANLQLDTQINARVTCRKGSRRVRHSYQQNLR